MHILTILITALCGILSSIAVFLIQRNFKKNDERERRRDEQKAQETVLIIKSVNAVGHLTEATAIALRDGKTNGELSAALHEYGKVDREMYNYLVERGTQK